jgi:hypothetical protein
VILIDQLKEVYIEGELEPIDRLLTFVLSDVSISNGAVTTSVVPSSDARQNSRFFYATVKGDGLLDLVIYNPNDDGGGFTGGVPRVRPCDGRGGFRCVDTRRLLAR